MAKERIINTKFWNDTWIREALNALDRYFFIYLLTNDKTNISGIYEIPSSTIAIETGIDKDEIINTMFSKLKPKAYYKSGWVIITNFLTHQHLESDNVIKGIVRELKNAPNEVVLYAKEMGYGKGIDRVWEGYHILNLTKLNLTKPTDMSDKFEVFWDLYPTKVAKKKSLQAWTKIKLTENLFQQIIQSLKAHKESDRWSRGIIPHPTTWINQERWDEVLQKAKVEEKKPYYKGDPIVVKNGRRYVIAKSGEWLQYAGKESEIEYK